MALQLNISACPKHGCHSIILNETTGAYDVTLNDTGWGAPNPLVSDPTTWSIIVTLPDETIVTITDPVGLPTADDALEYEITLSALGLTSSTIPDGLYTIEYTATISGTVHTSGTKYFLFTCNLDCCVNKMFAKIATLTDCACDSTVIKNALYAHALLMGLKASAGCGDTTSINSLLTKLNTICGFTDGDCGCS
jgi:hypothetical protein